MESNNLLVMWRVAAVSEEEEEEGWRSYCTRRDRIEPCHQRTISASLSLSLFLPFILITFTIAVEM